MNAEKFAALGALAGDLYQQLFVAERKAEEAERRAVQAEERAAELQAQLQERQ